MSETKTLAKTYNPQEVEDKWYQHWERLFSR